MTDAEFEEQQNRLQPIAEKWTEVLGLGCWKIDLHYERVPDVTAASKEERDENWQCNFVIYAKWTHLKAAIYINTPSLEDLDDEQLEKSFVHEFCHILVNELREVREDWLDHEERVAETLAKAFIRLRNQGLNYDPQD